MGVAGVTMPLDARVRAAFVVRAKRRWPQLSPQMATLLYLACTGRTSRSEQQRRLCIGINTCKIYRVQAFEAVGAQDQASAVMRVWRIYLAAERTAQVVRTPAQGRAA